MKTFTCHCGNALFFENTRCMQCGRTTGFVSQLGELIAFEGDDGVGWTALHPALRNRLFRRCRHYAAEHVCNWMVDAGSAEAYCQACRLNQTIPDLSDRENRRYWRHIETAKRRLIYTLNRLSLPVYGKQDDAERGLAFAFLADPDPQSEFSDALEGHSRAVTGHDHGLVTINIAEADPVKRERTRREMRERYRTLLGHFRHEIGHYYWFVLLTDSPLLPEFRRLFGDERADYAQALRRYYAEGPVGNWVDGFISAYASSHPWEDWAESFAHYLHMVDTLEAAEHLGYVSVPETLRGAPGFDLLVGQWIALTIGLNELNRCMGLRDVYPFVLSPPAREKLRFVHDLLSQAYRLPLEKLRAVGTFP